MTDDVAASSSTGSETLDRWTARKIRPIVILYILGVFAIFIVLAIVVFHSQDAVKALLLAAVGAVGATVPGIMERVEYRLTGSGIEKRPVKKEGSADFKEVFRWDELSRVVFMRHGFKFFKSLAETNPLGRFWKTHFSDRFSGEVHVEKEDLPRVLEVVARHGVTISERESAAFRD